MRKLFVVGIAIALFAVTGTAMADTTNVAVTASVTPTCKFTGTGTVAFTLDPATGGLATGLVSQPTFWCTKGAAYTITDDDGVNESGVIHQLKHATLTEYIPYSFTYTTAGPGAGKNNPVTMNIASTIQEGDYINASSGNYTDWVTLTINP